MKRISEKEKSLSTQQSASLGGEIKTGIRVSKKMSHSRAGQSRKYKGDLEPPWRPGNVIF